MDGLWCDGNFQCLDVDMKPIEGLFAVGNASGPFFGNSNYPMDIEGLSVGRAITTGFATAATSPACRLANGAFLTLPLSRRPSPGVGFARFRRIGDVEKAGLATDWDFWKMWGMFSGNNFELLDIRFPEDGLISSKEELGKDFPPFERQKRS